MSSNLVSLFRIRTPLPTLLLVAADSAVLIASIWAGMLLSYASVEDLIGTRFRAPLAWQSSLFVVVVVVSTFAMGMHQRQFIRSLTTVALRLGIALGASVLALGTVFYLLPPSRIWLSAMVPAILFGYAGMFGLRVIYRHLARTDLMRRRILVIGTGRRARRIEQLERADRSRLSGGFVCVGFVRSGNGPIAVANTALIRDQALPDLVCRLGVQEIVVASDLDDGIEPAATLSCPVPAKEDSFWEPSRRFGAATRDGSSVAVSTRPALLAKEPEPDRRHLLQDLLSCRLAGIPVTDYLSFVEYERGEVEIDELQANWLIHAEGFAHGGVVQDALKRGFDILAALGFLLSTLPLMAFVALAIWIDDPGPVFYAQRRAGRGGRTFKLLKFRSMRVDAEKDGIARWATVGDTRTTRVGAFLRCTRLDELPQVFNILRGEMSIVGPRPERPEFVKELAEAIPFYDCRHAVKPGLTGWAQINYPYGASIEDAREKLKLDLYYVKNHSLFLDALVLVQTARVILWPMPQRN